MFCLTPHTHAHAYAHTHTHTQLASSSVSCGTMWPYNLAGVRPDCNLRSQWTGVDRLRDGGQCEDKGLSTEVIYSSSDQTAVYLAVCLFTLLTVCLHCWPFVYLADCLFTWLTVCLPCWWVSWWTWAALCPTRSSPPELPSGNSTASHLQHMNIELCHDIITQSEWSRPTIIN